MDDLGTRIQKEVENLSFIRVDFDQSIIESKLLDSINVVDLIVFIEDATGIQIPNADVHPENFDTINRILTYLNNRR